MRNAQNYIEQKYPKLIQQNLKKLDISDLNLKGYLDLKNFPKLEELNCSNNFLTYLDLSKCDNLKKLNGDGNDDLQVAWSKTVSQQVRYSRLGSKEQFTPEEKAEIRRTKIKKQRRQGTFIPNSVVWNNLHSDFNFELSQEWKNLGFTYEQTQEWINVGFKPQELKLCVWLRDIKQVDAEWVLNYASERKVRIEFEKWQQREIIAQIEVLISE